MGTLMDEGSANDAGASDHSYALPQFPPDKGRASLALLASEKRYELLVEAMNDGLVSIDANLKVNYANHRFTELLGYSMEELIGRTLHAFMEPASQSIYDAQLVLRRQGKQSLYQIDWLRRDGTPITTLVSGTPFLDEQGRFLGSFAVVTDLTLRKQAEEERLAHLRFFERMDQVNRAIQGTNDLDQMLRDVLDTLLTIFECDRASFVYPCDPDARIWRVPMERTRPEYPGLLPIGVDLPLDPVGAHVYRLLRASPDPVLFGPGATHPVPFEIAAAFHVQSFIGMAFYPKVGKAWSFVLHQCSYGRVWNAEEIRLFKEISRRLADALSTILSYQRLQASEDRYRNLFNVMDEGVAINEIIRDAQGQVIDYQILDVNPAFTRHSVYSREQVIGQRATNIYHMQPEFIQQWWEQHRGSETVVHTDMYYEPTKRWFHIMTTPPYGDRFATFSVDISANKRLENTLREREQHSQSLLRLSRGLEFVETYLDVLNLALEEVRTVLGYQNLWAYLMDDDRHYARLLAVGGHIRHVLLATEEVVTLKVDGDPMMEEIVNSRSIVIVEDARTDPRTRKELVAMLNNRTIINVPIITFDYHMGAIGTGTFGDEGVRVPTPTEQEYLIAMASNIASAFHRLNLLTKRREAEEVLQRYNERLSTLHDIDHHILGASSPEAIARAVLTRLERLIPCEWLSIVLYNRELTEERAIAWQQASELQIHVGDSQPVVPNDVLERLKAGLSVVTPDLATQHGPKAQLAEDLETQHVHSAMANPMLVQGRLIGVLALASTKVNFFTLEHQQIAEEIADQIAIALHQAELYDQIAQHNLELEQRVRDRTAELEHVNRELEMFSYSVSHDLRAPLRAVQGFAEIIARRHRSSLNEEGQRYFDYIVDAGGQMNQLITDLLDYSRLGRQHVRLGTIPLRKLLLDVIEMLRPQVTKYGAQIELVETLPEVRGDKTLLMQIFANLLENGMIYQRPGVAPVLRVDCTIEPEAVVVRVADNGLGIDPEFHDKIFNVFQRLHSAEHYPGTGIGLAIVRRSVELLNGSIWLESTIGVGSQFYVKLPRPTGL